MKYLLKEELPFLSERVNFFNVTNGRGPQTYELELFLQDHQKEIEEGIAAKVFFLEDLSTIKESVDQDSDYFFSKDFFKKMKVGKIRMDHLSLLSFLHNQLSKKDTVEILKKIKGFTREVIVPLYIPEKNIAILTEEYNHKETMLNLLAMPDLKVFFCRYHYINEEIGTAVIACELRPTQRMMEMLRHLEEDQHAIRLRASKQISKIKARYKKEQYVSLTNEEGCRGFYNSLSEEEKRILHCFLILQRGESALKPATGFPETLMKFAKQILPMELFLQAVHLLCTYEEENKEAIDKDFKRPETQNYLFRNLRYRNRFTEYKLLLKEVNKRYHAVYKWVQSFYHVVQKDCVTSSKKPNVDSLHYKAALEAAEEISKLWFVSELMLFGSVAKGEETDTSDIDLAFQIGFDIKHIPDARKETFYLLVKNMVRKIENKYEELMPAYPKFRSDPDPFHNKVKISMFNLIGLPFQKKSALKMYETTGFFQNAVTLFKRDSFLFRFNDMEERIAYKDVSAVVSPTFGSYNYIVQTIHESEELEYVRYIRYTSSYNDKGDMYYDRHAYSVEDFVASFVCVEKRDKKDLFSRHFSRPVFFLIRNKEEYDNFIEVELNQGDISLGRHPEVQDDEYYFSEEVRELWIEIENGAVRSV